MSLEFWLLFRCPWYVSHASRRTIFKIKCLHLSIFQSNFLKKEILSLSLLDDSRAIIPFVPDSMIFDLLNCKIYSINM